jgi:hypothetical protein
MRTYKGVQKEFSDWCKERYENQLSCLIVTEAKLLLFLQQRVVGRQSRKRRRGSDSHIIGVKSILNAVSAIVDLWKQQSFMKVWKISTCFLVLDPSSQMNSNPNPRGALIKEYIKSLSSQENNRRRANYHDRGIGTFADGYLNLTELSLISNDFFNNGCAVGIRDRCAFLLAHYAMIRGENIRNLEFADLLCVDMPNEGPDPCTALVLMMLQGILSGVRLILN